MIGLMLLAVAGASAHPAKSDQEVWELARKVNSQDAYGIYMKRFIEGAHYKEAVKRFWRFQGKEPPPPAPPPVRVPLAPSELDPCSKALVDHDVFGTESVETKALIAAQGTNRLDDYREFLKNFPAGMCRSRAEEIIAARERLRGTITAIPGFGPLAAQARTRMIFSADDYPVNALRNEEQGGLEAEWDVAEDGISESCRVIRSSGSQALDNGTCRIILRRMRYDPARDERGSPVRSTDHMNVIWRLPEEDPPAPSGSPR